MSNKRKQELVFIALMVAFMATSMLSYNAVLMHGFTLEALEFVLVRIVPSFAVAFLLIRLFVLRLAARLRDWLLKPEAKEATRTAVMTLLMTTTMSGLMSFYATLLMGTTEDFFQTQLTTWARNWPVALALNVLAVRPLVTRIHTHIFRKAKAEEALQTAQPQATTQV